MRIIFIILFGVYCLSAYAQDNSPKDSLFKEAQEHYKNGKAYSLKGNYYKANEEFKKAEGLLSKAGIKEVKVDYKSKESYGKAENIIRDAAGYVSKGDDKNAISYYLRLLHFMPENGDVHYNLGIEYIKKRDYFDATQEFMQATRMNPEDADACYNLGILYEIFLNDKRMAGIYYKKYLKIDPEAKDKNMVQEWVNYLERKE